MRHDRFVHHLLPRLLRGVLLLTMPSVTAAQTVPDLVVRLRDAADQPVVGAIVTVSAPGASPLTLLTGGDGRAPVGHVPPAPLHIRIAGRLEDGTALRMPPADVDGMLLVEVTPPTTLDLRVDADGTVRPDPVTMLARDSAPPRVASPTLDQLTPAAAASDRVADAGNGGTLLLTVLLGIVTLAVMLALAPRAGRQP